MHCAKRLGTAMHLCFAIYATVHHVIVWAYVDFPTDFPDSLVTVRSGYEPERIMVSGDGENDVPLFQATRQGFKV